MLSRLFRLSAGYTAAPRHIQANVPHHDLQHRPQHEPAANRAEPMIDGGSWTTPDQAHRGLEQLEATLALLFQTPLARDVFVFGLPARDGSGFAIDIFALRNTIFASFGGLEQTFDDVGTAVEWTRRALSPSYRLQQICIGAVPRSWWLEPAVPHTAAAASLRAGYIGVFDRCRRQTVTYRQNTILPEQ